MVDTHTHSIHQYSVTDINDQTLDFSSFRGRKILIVNVASECGYTPQYHQLQELYDHHKDQLIIIGIPCNDFGGQEPGKPEEILQFCETKYGISFPLTQKMGIAENPGKLIQFLTSSEKNGRLDVTIKWNFHKFLLDEEGILIADFPSAISPLDKVIMDAVAINS